MTLFYAWNMWTDEIKIFRFEYARNNFVKNDDTDNCDGNWVEILEEDLK